MKKRKMTILTVILLMLFVTSSWAEKSKFQTYLTAGRSIIYSEDNPENISLINKKYYESANYGIILQFDKHLLGFNYKYFQFGFLEKVFIQLKCRQRTSYYIKTR